MAIELRSPTIAPVDSRRGLQANPSPSVAAAMPPTVPPKTIPCGMIAGRPSRNQVTAAAMPIPETSRRIRRIPVRCALKTVSITSPVAIPVGNGSPSSTTSRRLSSTPAKMPSMATATPNKMTAQVEKWTPRNARAGIGPMVPVTKLMTAADDATVWLTLVSRGPYAVRPGRFMTAKIPKASKAAVMLQLSMTPVLKPV